MEPRRNYLYVTFVEKEGPFLKLWGQTEKNVITYIEQMLNSFSSQFDSGLCIPQPDGLQIGILCCAKYKDGKYYRAKISSLDFLQNRYVEVYFVDHGNKDLVPILNIRSLEGFDNSFIAIPPLAHSFILAEAICPRGEWNEMLFEMIAKELLFTEVNFTIVAQIAKHFLAKVFIGGNDLALLLISRGLMQHTSVTAQEAVLLSIMPRTTLHLTPPQIQPSVIAYKAFVLEPGNQYEVYVSYVTDGPCNFSVQLKQTEEMLGKLMKEINSMTLTPIEGFPLPGTVCLSRCQEDGHICRAVVTNEVDGHLKVFYVDFGNYETVPLDALYEIPIKFVLPKAMAIRFALAGLEKASVTIEMQCAFKKFVDNRLIQMKVLPNVTRTALPSCELWDPETQQSALDVVNRSAANYPEPITLNRGHTATVKVSYVYSCNRFYVQLKTKLDDLTRLMSDIQKVCKRKDPLTGKTLKVGLPCYALFETDQQWYRAQIVEILDNGNVKVQYVDFGNDEEVSGQTLKSIEGKQLASLRPQAIECCLNGYQNLNPDLERDNLLEALILEQEFSMKVVDIQNKKLLIELIDAANYNIASILLDKIAATRSQVSPMLVQAGNKIEHRKQIQPVPRHLEPKRIERSIRTENGNTNEYIRQSKLRPDAKPFKKDNQSNRNEMEVGDNWRQSREPNAGFNKNRDRDSRSNEYGDTSEKKSFKSPNKDDWGASNDEARRSFSPRKRNDSENKSKVREWDVGKEKMDTRKPDNWGKKDDNWGKRDKKTEDWGNQDKKKDDWGDQNKNDNNWGKSDGNNDNWGASNKQDNWGKSEKQDDWNSGENKRRGGGFENRRDGKNFKDGERRPRTFDNKQHHVNGDAGEWNGDGAPRGGFKKPPFKRETSGVSSTSSGGSDKGGRKHFNRKSPKTDAPAPPTTKEVPDPAPSDAVFAYQNLRGKKKDVTISWFHNPGWFYTQTEDYQADFKQMMTEIQQSYKDYTPGSAEVGSPIIGLFPEDKVVYRAKVLAKRGLKYKVSYIDFGNVAIIDTVWPIEKRFMTLPAQAICSKLDGVEPFGETWSTATNYGPYFSKDKFSCQFGQFDGERYYTMLSCDGQDIRERLINDGLVKSAPLLKQIETPLLIGQQFRVMLLSVNNLGDFSVYLQNETTINCAVTNFDISTETFEDNLKQKLGQLIIIYVDDLDNDKLLVTPYDADGVKIKLIDKDEEAYESVDILCPYLVLCSAISGAVTHFNEEDKTLYIQPSDCTETIEYLLNTIYESYETSTLETPLVPLEGYIYAVKSSDANWYRGRVTKLEDSKATVMFVDYGNTETVDFLALREITREFMEITVLCLPVIVKDATPELIETSVVIVLQYTENGWEGTLESPEVAQVEETIIEAAIEPTEVPNVEAAPLESRVEGNLVVLSHMDSPSDFYLHLAESLTVIETLQATLQEKVVEMPDVENPVVGALCAAPYTLDQQWYRANILDADADITTVRFVDYGNTDVIDNKTTKLKTLSSDLLALETHATRCRLEIKPMDEEWSPAACEKFEQMCGVQSLTAQFLSQDEKTNYVELFSDGINIREALINENLAQSDKVASETLRTVGFVSHLNSPSEFWIQLENCVEELEWVAEQLTNAESFKELQDLAPGTLCAALYPDDEMWYRARILSNTVAGIEVLFVDYGNSCTSCSLRELPEELLMLAPLAQKCSLTKPDNLIAWGPEMIKKLGEISAEGQTTFTVNKLTNGETALVQLLLDEQDVSQLLLPKVENVTVTKCDDLNALNLSRDGQNLEGIYQLDVLQDIEWNEESLKKFQEIVDINSLLQAEFLDNNVVRLYVDYNDIRLELGGTKLAPGSSPVKRPFTDDVEPVEDLKNDTNGIATTSQPEDNQAAMSVCSTDVIKPILSEIIEQVTQQIEPGENKFDTNSEEKENKPIENGIVDKVDLQTEPEVETEVRVEQEIETKIVTTECETKSNLIDESDEFQECLEETIYFEMNSKTAGTEFDASTPLRIVDADEKDDDGAKEKPVQTESKEKCDKDERPGSAGSGKIPHDEKIVSAYFSRPQTPITSGNEDEDQLS